MRYLIYSNTGLTSKQIGLTGEIIEQLKKGGAELLVVLCDNVLENCYFNRSHNVLGCAACQSRLINILKQVGVSNSEMTRLRIMTELADLSFPVFNKLEELLGYEYDGIKVGRGAASSIISYRRDYHVTSEKYGELIEIELRKSINVLLNFQTILADFEPDEIYLFNGRFAEVFPLVELAKKWNIPFYTMESGSGNNYELFKNHLPHSIKLRSEHIQNYWNKGEETIRDEKAKEWFDSKRGGSAQFEISFTGKQQKGLIPDNFDKTKNNIVIFNSSEDELKAIMEWQSHLYEYQNRAIEQIVSQFSEKNEFHFYLRVHPNLGKVKNVQIDEIKKMNFDNLTIIPPESTIDTYRLIDIADKVITFGSSVGIESTYWGTTSILYGKAFYLHLDVAYVPQSFNALVKLIEQTDLPPKLQSATFPYGYYMSGYGKETTSFRFDGLKGSTFKGNKIKSIYPGFIRFLFRYVRRISLWTRLHKIYYNESFGLKAIKKYK